MRQKIQLGAALLTAKKILLIDEAMNGLDSLSLHYLKKHLREKREQGLSIVLASHFIPLVTEISDRILLLNKGRLLYEFSAADVKNIEAQTGFEKYVISLIETDQSAD
jgi:ABC-2 type transport system ATP-binding protein